jgi:FMN phosphatase YigB (HAD superfamily)
MTRRPKLIVCDLGDVLITGLEGVEHVLAPALGRPVDEVAQTLYGTEFGALWRGEIEEIPFLTALVRQASWDIEPADLSAMIAGRFAEIAGVRSIYQRLAESYVTALASVNCREWTAVMQGAFPYEHIFHSVVYSYEVKALKRESSFFRLPTIGLGFAPEDMLLIDDSSRNLRAARAAGVDGIKFISAAELSLALCKRGLL